MGRAVLNPAFRLRGLMEKLLFLNAFDILGVHESYVERPGCLPRATMV
jgi:hypothetical protein